MIKRHVELVVLSDLHLGTYGCQAKQLQNYLKTIDPEMLVLNGDIIDIWNFSKSYFPKSHIQVLRQIIRMTEKGTKTYYLTGNHDEALRKYSGTVIGNFVLDDKLILELDGKKIWLFHGDIFDTTTKGWARILAKLGGKGYDILIWTNRLINDLLQYFGREKISFSKRVKSSVKKAVKWISNFETTAAALAIDQKFDTVICGHIHQPQDRIIQLEHGSVHYLNSGDWVENCTALEYNVRQWTLYKYPDNITNLVHNEIVQEDDEDNFNNLSVFNLTSLYEIQRVSKPL
ncbi:MAG: UDP-2,3-diacylglucosamine diphosphatase [Saprospiraceae bacterium]|nr:UDP-2,3-diacylglucosamine diphosphatase [Saprospiraceae bacterium]MBP8212877.1 UDP-2,3-diacylglucosamine diphosphatase [Saprospiraceae bacterium]HQV67595.1 UDP-2,3-diacylglucosamine diphosphatase [Saprospiraceae bacterium]